MSHSTDLSLFRRARSQMRQRADFAEIAMAVDGLIQALHCLGLILVSISSILALCVISMAEGACWPATALHLLTATLISAPE